LQLTFKLSSRDPLLYTLLEDVLHYKWISAAGEFCEYAYCDPVVYVRVEGEGSLEKRVKQRFDGFYSIYSMPQTRVRELSFRFAHFSQYRQIAHLRFLFTAESTRDGDGSKPTFPCLNPLIVWSVER